MGPEQNQLLPQVLNEINFSCKDLTKIMPYQIIIRLLCLQRQCASGTNLIKPGSVNIDVVIYYAYPLPNNNDQKLWNSTHGEIPPT